MKGEAIAYGAITVVSALATGFGAALGVDTWTKANVTITDEPGVVKVRILSDPSESDALAKVVVKKTLKRFNLEKTFGAYVETDSNIPIAKGLKSSSVAANAITLATLAALNRHLDDLSVVNLGVDASMEAKVTITGAFDDACASYFGGVVFTNNLKRKLIKRVAVKDDFLVLIQVPREKSYTTSVNVDRLGPYRSLISMAFERALRGDLWSPFMLNGMVHSIAFGYNPRIAFQAMDKGAISAGLTGTGPSVAAIVPLDKVDLVKELFSSYEGDVIEAKINLKKAHVLMSTQS